MNTHKLAKAIADAFHNDVPQGYWEGLTHAFKIMTEEEENPIFMIGQRVVYHNVICVVCAPETEGHITKDQCWIDNPEKGYKHWVEVQNIKPLPNGQL